MNKIIKALKGFTLIEILIALAIFAIIAVSLFSTFSAGVSAWKRAEQANRIYLEAKLSLDEIASNLKNAAIFDFSKNYPGLKSFQGSADEISFLTLSDSGLKRVSYFLEKPDYGSIHKVVVNKSGKLPEKVVADYKQSAQSLLSLQEKIQDFTQSLSGNDNGSVFSSLTSLVKEGGLKFEFAFLSGGGKTPAMLSWKDNFESPNQLPRLVKITLTLLNPKNLNQERTFTRIVFIPTGEMPAEEE